MSLQKYFKDFNDAIRLDFDVNSELSEKRDILLKKLKNSEKLPSFNKLDQGSYAMHTGVESIDKEYDIDVALRFNVNKDDYEPMELKNIIYDILKEHTEYGAKIKNPCVTVTYKKQGEAAYHVDLVAYTYEDKDNTNSQLYLARGKDSKPEDICWEKSDPKGLVDLINKKFDDDKEDKEQYRRVIRYIKRWKNLNFDGKGNGEPPSIAITLIAEEFLEISKEYDCLEERYKYDDLNAVLNFAKKIQSLFVYENTQDSGRDLYRIRYYLPNELNFESDVDLFRKMTDIQMTNFKDKIDKLVENLEEVKEEDDEVEQCKLLNKIFGDDFKVPDKENASKKQMNYIPSSSASGVEYGYK